MNYKVLKDIKTMGGFILSIMLIIIAVALAANDNDFWVFCVVVSMPVFAFSVKRADNIYKLENGNINQKNLKDVKIIAGYIASLLLGVIALVLAAKAHDLWVFFLFVFLAVSALIVVRANKRYKED